MKVFKSFALFFFFLLSVSCTTTVGPRGPQGFDGADGVQIYSSTSPIYATDFVIMNEYISINEFSWNILDERTVDYGLVLAYVQFGNSTSWHALPFATPFGNDFVNLRYIFDIVIIILFYFPTIIIIYIITYFFCINF